MASVKFEKGSREWHMFQDYWRLCQKFWIPEEIDKYWDDLINEISEFLTNYKDVPLASKIAPAFINCQDRKCQNRHS